MENLWAPWRSGYVKKEKPLECVFCAKFNDTDDSGNFVLYRGESIFVIMNLYPYNSGHIMLLPIRHVAEITDLHDSETVEMSMVLKKSLQIMQEIIRPDGFNVGYNIGSAAGAGIAAHLHQHIVPRWSGDTNFMPVVGRVRVISEDISQMYLKLKKGFSGL